jgi:hypothetical protein
MKKKGAKDLETQLLQLRDEKNEIRTKRDALKEECQQLQGIKSTDEKKVGDKEGSALDEMSNV